MGGDRSWRIKLFRDRAFNLSILFSTAWHLFWMVAIGIVITPSVQPSDAYQEVSFLGPILEKTAFDLMVEQAAPHAETLYASATFFLDNVYLRPKGPERKIVKEFVPETVLDRFAFSLGDYVKTHKEVPFYFAEDIRGVYADGASKVVSPDFSGPAGEREIIFKPARITVPRGLYSDSEEYIVKLKFFVLNNGIVHDVEPIVSSGYPGIDLQAIRFIKRWRFSPLSMVRSKGESAWGVITVRIEAK